MSALAIGMWACVLFEGRLLCLYGLLSLLLLGLNLTNWKRGASGVMIGWLVAGTLQIPSFAKGHESMNATVSEWLLVDPLFMPSRSQLLSNQSVRGIWRVFDQQGNTFKIWMESPDVDVSHPRWAWVTHSLAPQSDIASAFDFQSYLTSNDVFRIANFHFWGAGMDATQSGNWWRDLSLWWNDLLSERFEGDGAGLIFGVFAGDRKAVDPSIRDAFAQLGIAHLLSVSGYHVGLVSMLFVGLLRSQNRRIRMLSLLGPLVSLAYVACCGFPLSGIRAWLMISCAWILLICGRRQHAWTAFGVAACAAVFLDPSSPRQLGAQLSFLATGSLLALNGINAWWRVPLRAQMATSFLTLPSFSVIPWLFYPANILAGPMMVVLGLTFFLGLLGIPGTQEWAEIWSNWMSSACKWIVENHDVSTPSRMVSGATGFWLLLSVSLFWLFRMVDGVKRQNILRGAWCCATIGACFCHTMVQANVDGGLRQWSLRGWPSCWFVTDGYGSCAWCKKATSEMPERAARFICAEGPVAVMTMDPGADTIQQWIQPPFEVWIHRDSSRQKSVPTSYGDFN